MSDLMIDYSSRFSRDFRAGVDEACDLLATWQEADAQPQVIAGECLAELERLSGDHRSGFMNTIAAYLACCFGSCLPVLGRWDVYREISGVFNND